MTDRESNEPSDHERHRAPVPPQDPPAPDEPTRLAAPHSDVRPSASTSFGGGDRPGEDPFGPRAGAAPSIPEYGVPAPTGEPEESTAAVSPRGESTGPTQGFAPDQGARQAPPPPMPPMPTMPPSRPGVPPRPLTEQTMPMTPEMQAWVRQQRQPSGEAGPGPERGAPQQQWSGPPTGPPRQWGPPPPGQRPVPPPPGRPDQWSQPADPREVSGSWPEGYRHAPPSNFNYSDTIRSSELVPNRKLPPRHGWRKAILSMSFGTINLGRSPDERQQDELEAKIRTLLRGRYKIGVLGKGGTGKTTLAASLGSIFAELRQDDRVVAIDADTAFGKLASRIDPQTAGSYWELAADQHLNTFADVRSRVGSNSAGLFVLAGEHNTARRRVLDPAIYREAATRLDNHFTISIVDCGSTMDSPVTREALADLDALLVVSSPWVDGASAAGQTMDWLAANGYTGLMHRTVVVLNDSDGHADKKTRKLLAEGFSGHGQVVVQVPFDPHLRPGGVIDVDNQLNRTTRRRLLEIAATIAEHFAATTDGHRERR